MYRTVAMMLSMISLVSVSLLMTWLFKATSCMCTIICDTTMHQSMKIGQDFLDILSV